MSAAPVPAVITGATATGKSALAMALAQAYGAEIISMDSAQVYRQMDIGTAKPSAQERAAVPHHLLDILDPAQRYSAARFVSDCRRLIAEIEGRGRPVLIVGGTNLYLRALEQGLNALPSADPELRLEISAQAEQQGWPAQHRRLAELDPAAAERLHPNDGQRIQRALEIVLASGRQTAAHYAQPRTEALGRPLLKFAVMPPDRETLHRRIATRFEQMMAKGLLDELRRLHARDDLGMDLPSVRSVGYRQLWRHLDGELSESAAVDAAIAASRQFAKRQLTWLRSEPQLQRLNAADSALFEGVSAQLQAAGWRRKSPQGL